MNINELRTIVAQIETKSFVYTKEDETRKAIKLVELTHPKMRYAIYKNTELAKREIRDFDKAYAYPKDLLKKYNEYEDKKRKKVFELCPKDAKGNPITLDKEGKTIQPAQDKMGEFEMFLENLNEEYKETIDALKEIDDKKHEAAEECEVQCSWHKYPFENIPEYFTAEMIAVIDFFLTDAKEF